MFKRLFLLFLLVLLGILGVLAFNYLSFKQPSYAEAFPAEAVHATPEALSAAIQCQTIAHKKEMRDSAAFAQLFERMDSLFPKVNEVLELSVLDGYALLYKWKGHSSEAPVVLMAHMDVVPVEYASKDQWEVAPFSGEVHEGYIYGRGALDDKGSYVSILNSIQHLLDEGFTPAQDVYFCFGPDEEIGGEEGAVLLAAELQRRGVRASLVLDEGGFVAQDLVPGIDKPVALIGISEKGYMSVDLSVNMRGGHSSMPEKRSATSALNQALYALEQNKLPARLSAPLEGFVSYVGPNLPFVQKLAFSNRWAFEPLIFSAYEKSPGSAALIHTTQAITILQAGIKDNVVPSRAVATVNYRLLPGDSPEEVMEHMRKVIADTAVRLSIHEGMAIPPSPVSPYKSAQFSYVQRCVSGVFPDALVSPYLVIGATDGRHFYEVSEHVYRFLPITFTPEDVPRLHGVNERLHIDAYAKAVQFYVSFIRHLEHLKPE